MTTARIITMLLIKRGKLGQISGPLRIGKRIVHFVGAAVALLPHQDAGIVGDHRDQKQVERPCNHLQQAVGHRQERISKAFGVAVDQRRHAVQQSESGDHDERRRLHQPLEFDLYRAPELQPFRAGAEISGSHWNRRAGDRNAFLSFDFFLSWTPFRKAETPVGESKDHGADPSQISRFQSMYPE